MAGQDLTVACRCGAFEAIIKDASPKSGSHLLCYCKDCQAEAHYLGATDYLETGGATDIYQTTPDRIAFVKGVERLACLRLSPKGLLRWYCDCCNTPMFNTLASPKLAFVGVFTKTLQGSEASDAIGPLIGVANVDGVSHDMAPPKRRGEIRAFAKVLLRQGRAMLRGTVGQTPFFDTAGQPVVTPKILTLDERKAATP